MFAIDRTQTPRRAAPRRFARHTECSECALLVDMPAFQVERVVMQETTWLALIDNQRTDQATPELLTAGYMRVIPKAARIGTDKVVIKILARQHRCLRHIRHTVHGQRQTNAMPVNGGGHL